MSAHLDNMTAWLDIRDDIADKIERAYAKGKDATSWLHLMDLIDPETAEYYREGGIHSVKQKAVPTASGAIRPVVDIFS